jgi:hypothetical protein
MNRRGLATALCAACEQARDMRLGGEFRQLEFRILKFRDGFAEDLACAPRPSMARRTQCSCNWLGGQRFDGYMGYIGYVGYIGCVGYIGYGGAPYLLGILPSFSGSLLLLFSVTVIRLGQMNLLNYFADFDPT